MSSTDHILAHVVQAVSGPRPACAGKEFPNVVSAVVVQGTESLIVLNIIPYLSGASSNSDEYAGMADMFYRNQHSYESTYRMMSYRWNELQAYNSFLLRCTLITAMGMLIIVLTNLAFITTSIMNALVVVLVVIILFMVIIEYSMLKLRVRKDFTKIRF